jgi:hypothetical protein
MADDLRPNFLTCPGVPELPPPEGEVFETVPEPAPRQPWKRYVLFGGVCLFLLALAPLAYGGVRAGVAVRRVQEGMRVLQAHLFARDFEAAEGQLAQVQADLGQVQDGLASTGFWQDMPVVGTQLQAFEEAGQAGSSALDGAHDLLQAASEVQLAFAQAGLERIDTGVAATRTYQDLSRDEKLAILSRIASEVPKIRLAKEKAALALDAWRKIPQDRLLPPIRSAFAPMTSRLETYAKGLDQGVQLAEVFLPLSGYPQPKTYLVLLQNADELRATGGFIGTVGILKLDAGEIKEKSFQDVYEVDNPVSGPGVWKDVPPEPMKRELGINAWFLRDSNWSPDFPTTAARIMDVYTREKTLDGKPPGPLSGVLALQPSLFRDLLAVTGPITLDGETYDAANFFDKLQCQVEVCYVDTGAPDANRKDVVGKLGDALVAALAKLPASKWPGLLDLGVTALERKDVLIFDADPNVMKLVDARGWSGRVKATDTDYLWVIDTNLAALKTDGVMDKEVRYAVDLTSPDGPTATVTLAYTNTNTKIDWRYSRYRDYVRVYVPEGSELVSSNGAMQTDKNKAGGKVVPGTVEVYRDLGKTVFAAFWAIEPGESRTLSFTYRLPTPVADALRLGAYRLLVQKQPGSKARLTVDAAFAKKVVAATPPEEPKEFGDMRYRVRLPLHVDETVDVRH